MQVFAYIEIKENEEAKQNRYSRNDQNIRRAKISEWKRKWGKQKTTLHQKWDSANNSCRHCEVKLSRLCIGHTRLTHGHLMLRKNQQPICTKAVCGNQTLEIAYYLVECLQWNRDSVKKIYLEQYKHSWGRIVKWKRYWGFLRR